MNGREIKGPVIWVIQILRDCRGGNLPYTPFTWGQAVAIVAATVKCMHRTSDSSQKKRLPGFIFVLRLGEFKRRRYKIAVGIEIACPKTPIQDGGLTNRSDGFVSVSLWWKKLNFLLRDGYGSLEKPSRQDPGGRYEELEHLVRRPCHSALTQRLLRSKPL